MLWRLGLVSPPFPQLSRRTRRTMEPKPLSNQRELWHQVFPWPDEVPMPRPRFGKALPPPPIRLPEPTVPGSSGSTQAPFRFSWQIEELALTISLREQQTSEGNEVWVDVASPQSDAQGKSVSVGAGWREHPSHEAAHGASGHSKRELVPRPTPAWHSPGLVRNARQLGDSGCFLTGIAPDQGHAVHGNSRAALRQSLPFCIKVDDREPIIIVHSRIIPPLGKRPVDRTIGISGVAITCQ